MQHTQLPTRPLRPGRTMRQPLLCALSLALLAGCANLAPDYQRPALPVPQQYERAAPGDSVALPAQWRDYFTDPQLQQLIDQALEHNRDLRMAVARVAQARAAYGIQSADQLPTLGVQAASQRSRIPADLNLTRKALHSDQYSAGIGLPSWELDFWGRVRNLSDAALENYLASEAARDAATTALIGQVAFSYLDLCDSQQRIALARRTLASRQQSFDMMRRRAAVGSSSQLQLTQVETLLIQARSLLLQLEQERDAQQHALALLVGAPANWPAAEQATASQDAAWSVSLATPAAGLPSDLLARRPDIAAAEHRLRAANANIGVARAAYFPQISLTGSFGTASAELNGLFQSGSRAWSFGPSISLPLFDSGRRSNLQTLAEARRDEALAAYDKTVQSAFRDVADALAALHWLDGQQQVASDAVRVQAQRARLSQLRYDSGASAYLDVLDAQRDLLSAEQQQVRARHAVQAARVSLYLALGGAAAPSHTATSGQHP